MRDKSSSFVMSAIVLGTYVCALYGAFGPPISARPAVAPLADDRPAPPRRPATGPALVTVADLTEDD